MTISALQLYKKLFSEFGSQGWWPTFNKKTCKIEYQKTLEKKFSEKELLEIFLGAILTQNTSWKNVEKALTNLSSENLIEVETLSSISKTKLVSIIKSAGYFNQKSERIILIAKYLQKNYSGSLNKLFSKPLQELRKELLSLKGIGFETADSILLYAAQKPVFVIDAYTKRVADCLQLFGGDFDYSNYGALQKEFEKAFQDLSEKEKVKTFNEFHALLVEFAKNLCQKKPLCEKCFLRKSCSYYKENY